MNPCSPPLLTFSPFSSIDRTSRGLNDSIVFFSPLKYIYEIDNHLQAALISTLRDSEFKPPPSQIVPQIIGTTNVFFVKALPNCPNVVSIGNDVSLLNGAQKQQQLPVTQKSQRFASRESSDSAISESGSAATDENTESGRAEEAASLASTPVPLHSSLRRRSSGGGTSGSSRGVNGPQILLGELKDGFWGKRRG